MSIASEYDVHSAVCTNPIFIVGTQRCGTTLLASILSSHSRIIITQETTLLLEIHQLLKRCHYSHRIVDLIVQDPRWQDFRISQDLLKEKIYDSEMITPQNVLNAFYSCFCDVNKKPRWGDNNPGYWKAFSRISQIWPSAHVIHMIRDARGVANSWMQMPWGPNKIEVCAQVWKERILQCREQAQVLKHYLEIKYEDLVATPQKCLLKICSFIKEPFEKSMLNSHQLDGRKRYGEMIENVFWKERVNYHKNITQPISTEISKKWETTLSIEEIKKVQNISGDLLTQLGYTII